MLQKSFLPSVRPMIYVLLMWHPFMPLDFLMCSDCRNANININMVTDAKSFTLLLRLELPNLCDFVLLYSE